MPDAPSSPLAAPREIDISDTVFEVLEAATRSNVVPLGSPFPDPALYPLEELLSPERGFRNCMRLNFAQPFTGRTQRAIATLGALARKQLEGAGAALAA